MTTTTPDRVCPGRHGQTPVPGDPQWCDAHQAMIRARLTALPQLIDALSVNPDGRLPAGRTVSDRVASRGVSPASPSPAHDATDHAVRWLRDWVDTVAAVLDHPDRRTTTWTPGAHAAAAYLGEHLDVLLATEGVATLLGTQILSTTDRVEKQAGLERLLVRMPVPCLRCYRRSLVREDGTDVVACTMADCGAMWPDEVWTRITVAVARHERAKASA